MGGGQSVPCQDVSPDENISVFTLSEEAVQKVMTQTEEGALSAEEHINQMDENWKESLKSMDDSHSCMLGLSDEEFYRKVQLVEGRFAQLTNTNAACHQPLQAMVQCYQKNPHQVLMCEKEMKEFSKCIDINTVEKVKTAAEEIRDEALNEILEQPDPKAKKKKDKS